VRRSDHPTFDGMPTPLYAAAPARLGTYLDCPRRYRFGYLDRPTPVRTSSWGHQSVGSAVHHALARWWDLPLARRTPAAGGELLQGAWMADGFRDARQSAVARERARGQVEAYLADVDPQQVPVAVERTLTVHTDHAALWGRVDRLDDRGAAGLVVVDYKTGRHVPTEQDVAESLALAVYAAAAAETLHAPCLRVELHHLPSATVVGWTHTPQSLAAHLDHADAVAAELAGLDAGLVGVVGPPADQAFPARVAARCGWCEFRPACREGQSVPRRLPWEAVAG
jgi:RecB family exonuclease